MLILVVGTDTVDIDKAVEYLTKLETSKEVLHFKDLIGKLGDSELPEVYDSIILLDYPDILAKYSSTKASRLLTYMVMQSRRRANTWIAKALDWKTVENAPSIDRRIDRAHEWLVTAGKNKMVIWDRRTNERRKLEWN